jgi:hypothetical protein
VRGMFCQLDDGWLVMTAFWMVEDIYNAFSAGSSGLPGCTTTSPPPGSPSELAWRGFVLHYVIDVPQPDTNIVNHERIGRSIMLFTRLRADDRAFWFLGPASYRGHVGEKPMAITWELATPLPGDLYQSFAAAV